MSLRDLVYKLYEERLEARLSSDTTPRHIGVILDGNRRWARSMGLADINTGHQRGADKISELLQWSQETGVEVVTLWLLSTDNLTRPAAELEPLLAIIENTVEGLAERRLARQAGRRTRPSARQDRTCAEACRRNHIGRSWADCERRGWVWR